MGVYPYFQISFSLSIPKHQSSIWLSHAAYLKLFFLNFIPDETMVLENLKYTRLLALSSLHKHGKLSFSTSSMMEWTPYFVFVAILKPYFSALLILILILIFFFFCLLFISGNNVYIRQDVQQKNNYKIVLHLSVSRTVFFSKVCRHLVFIISRINMLCLSFQIKRCSLTELVKKN